MTTKKKYETYRDGKLKIRKRQRTSYQGKIYLEKIKGISQYQYKSVKTDDKNHAISVLQDWCDEVTYLRKNNKELPTSNQKNRFMTWSKDYIDNFDRANNPTHKDDKKHHQHIMSWIKTENIKQVTNRTLDSLLHEHLPKITESQSTKGHWFNYIRKVYRYQVKNEVITKQEVPEFPKLLKHTGKRIFLEKGEYRHLISESIDRMNDPKLSRRMALFRKILNRFIIFQCATGMRPSETYNLRWRDISNATNDDTGERYLKIEVLKGKTKNSIRTVISKTPAYEAIKQLKKIYLEYGDILNKEKIDRDIIFPFNHTASNRTLLKSAKLYIDQVSNKKRDVYVYRHTYISWAVIKGEALFNIAKNCGNSVKMIEDHYANNLTSNHFKNTLSSLKKNI